MSDGASAGRPWAGRSHAELAELTRELLMAGHLIDRSGMPHLIARFGRDGMAEVAIGEWMSASPVYTKRMQRLLNFGGDTVEVIFKGMQLDVGAPPEFLDFRYRVIDDLHGEFHLDHCGALMDVEPMGPDYVQAMCHDIEDPTFDATATATNPRAQVRPVHRPPRVPADRAPHCAWTVTIVPEADPLPFPAEAERMSRSAIAQVPLATPDPTLPSDDGWTDYSIPLDPDLLVDSFSSATLSAVLDEVALQGQFLARAYLLLLADRVPAPDVSAIGAQQAAGVAGLVAKRLAAALAVEPGLAGLAAVLRVHPVLLPRSLVALEVTMAGGTDGPPVLEVTLGAGAGLAEADGLTWPAVVAGPGGDAVIDAIAVCLVPTATVERVGPIGDEVARWRITDHPGGPVRTQPDTVTLTEFSTGATFTFARRP